MSARRTGRNSGSNIRKRVLFMKSWSILKIFENFTLLVIILKFFVWTAGHLARGLYIFDYTFLVHPDDQELKKRIRIVQNQVLELVGNLRESWNGRFSDILKSTLFLRGSFGPRFRLWIFYSHIKIRRSKNLKKRSISRLLFCGKFWHRFIIFFKFSF